MSHEIVQMFSLQKGRTSCQTALDFSKTTFRLKLRSGVKLFPLKGAIRKCTEHDVAPFLGEVRPRLRGPLKARGDSKALRHGGQPLPVQLQVLQAAAEAVHGAYLQGHARKHVPRVKGQCKDSRG